MNSLSSLREKSEKGWTDTVKEASFAAFLQFPKEYEFLCNIFSLPPLQTLREWVDSMYLGSGFQKETLISLQHRLFLLEDEDRVCSLSLIEIPLKKKLYYCSKSDCIGGLVDNGNFGLVRKVADTALMFVVSGIQKQWTQPVGYFLKEKRSYKMLLPLIEECLRKLGGIDLNVRLLVFCFSKASKLLLQNLGISTSCPYRMFDNKKVFCMYCPSSLRTAVRNSLKRYDIAFGSKLCKWKFIEKFYELKSDMTEKFSLGTEDKVHLSSKEDSVDFCFDNESCGAGIYSMGACGLLDKEAEQTGEFVSKMYRLLMIFSSNPKKSLAKYPGRNDNELSKVLREFLNWIQSWKIDKVTDPLAFKEGWSITINCLLQLSDGLEKQCVFQYTNCRLTPSFGKIKSTDSDSLYDARHFDKMFRLFLVNSLFTPVKKPKGAANLTYFFVEFEEFVSRTQGLSRVPSHTYHYFEDCEKVDMPKVNTLGFVAVHMIKKLQLIVTCKTCLSELVQKSVVTCDLKNVSSQKKGKVPQKATRTVIGPHKKFLKILPKFVSSFMFSFKGMYHMPRIKVKIHQYMYSALRDEFSCMEIDCEDVKKILIGLFINISFEHMISKVLVSGGKVVIPE